MRLIKSIAILSLLIISLFGCGPGSVDVTNPEQTIDLAKPPADTTSGIYDLASPACANAIIDLVSGRIDSNGYYMFSPTAGVGLFGLVQNCSSGKKRYYIAYSAVSSCGVNYNITLLSPVAFAGGESIGITYGWPGDPNICLGLATVTLSVYTSKNGGTPIATASQVIDFSF